MRTALQNKLAVIIIAAVCSALPTLPAAAHDTSRAVLAAPAEPSAAAPVETVTGTLDELVVENRIANTTTRYVALRQVDGQYVTLSGATLDAFTKGAFVEASGRRNGSTLFLTDARSLPPPSGTSSAANKSKPVAHDQAMQAQGTLLLAHADDFATGRSAFNLVVRGDDGRITPLKLAVMPEVLQPGTAVIVNGTKADDGFSLAASYIVVVAMPKKESRADVVEKAATTNNVLVLMVKYLDSSATTFTQAQVQAVMTSNTNSVSSYYNEVSYGQHLLNATVTDWIPTNTNGPATCDYTTIGRDADAAYAAANPSDHTTYQNRFYIFPSRSDCGWAGLAYISFGAAWSNGYNLLPVFAHELGHNFGLLHAASMNCNGQPITAGATGCTSSEYGDPFSVMGGQATGSYAMHFNAAQKSLLHWIPAGSVATYTSGSATYTLSPIETAGGSTYAVKVPAGASRTFWLEYRQPTGTFDHSITYATNGAQIRVASPFQALCSGCADDTELLFMPSGAPGNYYNSALLAGQSFTDSGITMSVLSASPTALTVQVNSASAAATTTTISSSLNPSPAGASVTLTSTVTGVNPTSTVNFTDGGNTLSGCGAAVLSGSGSSKAATCSTAALSAGTHSIVATYGGDGSNTASASAALSQVVSASAGGSTRADFNADGKSDILLRRASDGAVMMWLMNGMSVASVGIIGNGTDWSVVGTGDFNGDGKSDILMRRGSDGAVMMWLMNGMGIVSLGTIGSGTDWSIAGVGDFNGDGKADILWRRASDGAVMMWLMNGMGAVSVGIIGTGTDWSVAGVGDFNGDGKADILMRRASDGAVMMWLMNGMSIVSVGTIGSGTDWSIAGVGDFNGDGKADILWRRTSDGAVMMWLMNGMSVSSVGTIGSGTDWSVSAPK